MKIIFLLFLSSFLSLFSGLNNFINRENKLFLDQKETKTTTLEYQEQVKKCEKSFLDSSNSKSSNSSDSSNSRSNEISKILIFSNNNFSNQNISYKSLDFSLKNNSQIDLLEENIKIDIDNERACEEFFANFLSLTSNELLEIPIVSNNNFLNESTSSEFFNFLLENNPQIDTTFFLINLLNWIKKKPLPWLKKNKKKVIAIAIGTGLGIYAIINRKKIFSEIKKPFSYFPAAA